MDFGSKAGQLFEQISPAFTPHLRIISTLREETVRDRMLRRLDCFKEGLPQ